MAGEDDPPVAQQQQQPQNVTVSVQNLSDLLPDAFSGESPDECAEQFFANFVLWVSLHHQTFQTEAQRVRAIRYCLTKSAGEWWQSLRDNEANVALPPDVDTLRNIFFCKVPCPKDKENII